MTDRSTPNRASYGTWPSPISAALLARGATGLDAVQCDGDWIYWLEKRSTEGGRQTVMRIRQGDAAGTALRGKAESASIEIEEVTPAPINVRSKVHEYGGRAYLAQGGVLYLCRLEDQQIYRLVPGAEAEQLTRQSDQRYAEPTLDSTRQRLICICEDHNQGNHEPENLLVGIDLDTGAVQPLVRGHDFFSSPCLSPDGQWLAWLSWDHPNMPWDGTDLWLARIDTQGQLEAPRHIAGGRDESIFQPRWSPAGVLHFISDRGGWWNIERWQAGKRKQVTDATYEFGLPEWVSGLSTYGFTAQGDLYCSYLHQGQSYLARIAAAEQQLENIALPFTHITSLQVTDAALYFIGAAPAVFSSLIQLSLPAFQWQALRHSSELSLDASAISVAQAISFPSADGGVAHAFYYPPANKDFVAPAQERPPLLVKLHGGPSSAAYNALDLQIQYWTSRGFAVMDLNYRGSSGFGRDYRRLLYGNWGVVDVEDAIHGCEYLVAQGLVDAKRIVIRGGSAGGFTVLLALAQSDTFSAGASYYGVTDLEALAKDTHKFESRYLDRIVGPYPEQRHIYQQRSPLNQADNIRCPVIFFQGLEDKVVPPSQTESMVNALQAQGTPVNYVTFANEQHGFRRAENIQAALEMELAFYLEVLGVGS